MQIFLVFCRNSVSIHFSKTVAEKLYIRQKQKFTLFAIVILLEKWINNNQSFRQQLQNCQLSKEEFRSWTSLHQREKFLCSSTSRNIETNLKCGKEEIYQRIETNQCIWLFVTSKVSKRKRSISRKRFIIRSILTKMCICAVAEVVIFGFDRYEISTRNPRRSGRTTVIEILFLSETRPDV